MNYENLSDDLKINIMSYLDYETNIALSQTNKNNNNLYKKIKSNNYISIYSTKKCYIHKRNKNINNIFYSLLFIKILSYNEKYITYKHIKYGNYDNYKYPINNSLTLSNFVIYFLSHDVINPSYGHKIVVHKSVFDSEYILYENKDINKTFKNKIFFTKFVIQSLCIYLFFYTPILIFIYFCYLFYFLFLITTVFVYIFHIILMYEILLTAIVTRNIHFIDYI